MLSEDPNKQAKSFWARPEGTTGMLFLAAAGVGLYAALPALLAFMTGVVALLGQTIAAVCLALVLGALLYVITNKKVQTLVSYIFKSAMRKLTGAFVEIDPIGIMKSYVEDLLKKRGVMETARDKLRGQISILEKKIRDNNSGYENAMSLASAAQKRGNNAQVSVQTRQAGRLNKLNKESFEPLLQQMQIHLRAINKYHEVTGTVIEDLKNEVEAQKVQREMIMSSYSAMKSAKAILMGGTDQKELFDQALEYVVSDYGMKMGEIDSFIENSRGFVEGLDMQNLAYEEAGLKKLQEWEQKADSILLGNNKQQMLEQVNLGSTINLGVGLPAATQVDYSQLIR